MQLKKKHPWGRLGMVIGLLVAHSALATSFLQKPFPDSVKDAPSIVRGKIGAQHAEWADGNDGFRRLYTYYPIEIKEVLKGDVGGGTLQMRELGGEKDHVGMQVAGSAKFSQGEDVVVFLGEKNTDGSRDVWGLMMGKFNVEHDEKGQEVLTGPGLGSAETEPGTIIDDEKLEGRPSDRHWSLDGLRRIVAAQGSAPSQSAPKAPVQSAKPVNVPMPQTSSSSAKSDDLGGFQPQKCAVTEPEACASQSPTPTAQGKGSSSFKISGLIALLVLGGGALAAARRRLHSK